MGSDLFAFNFTFFQILLNQFIQFKTEFEWNFESLHGKLFLELKVFDAVKVNLSIGDDVLNI